MSEETAACEQCLTLYQNWHAERRAVLAERERCREREQRWRARVRAYQRRDAELEEFELTNLVEVVCPECEAMSRACANVAELVDWSVRHLDEHHGGRLPEGDA